MSYATGVPVALDARAALEEAIEERGWSLEKTSRRLRTNKTKLFRVLRGQEPDLGLALRIEETFGISVRRWIIMICLFVSSSGQDFLELMDTMFT